MGAVRPLTVGEALAKARALPPLTPTTGQAILAHVTGCDRAHLLAHPEETLSHAQAAQLEVLLARAARGEPLAYLVGEKDFCGLTLAVTPDVLIPRPETEMLVEVALGWASRAGRRNLAVADVGTGSGAIAITLAVRLPEAWIAAVDVSRAALEIARSNAERHGVGGQIRFIQGDLLDSLKGPFDVLLANLPYIPTPTLNSLEVSRWEPMLALDGGPDGLVLVRRLIGQAASRLAEDGLLVLEIQADQGERVAALCREAFPTAAVSVERDLAGLDRVVEVDLAIAAFRPGREAGSRTCG